jgi:NAD(P)-dependent dehydrogenase (short-subunit alcohol dehydrogenase family)
MRKIIVVTGASNGLGRLASNSLARAGHTVYASMRETTGRNASRAAEVKAFARQHGADLRAIELDPASQESVNAAIARIIFDNGRLDVVVHSADHTVYGPAEAFTPEQLAQFFDNNVVSTQRINRAALPQLRKQGQGLMVWVSSSGMRGGTAPYLGPYFACKAAMDTLAVSYAGELARWGIRTGGRGADPGRDSQVDSAATYWVRTSIMAQKDKNIQIEATGTVDKSTLSPTLSSRADKAVQTLARLIGRQIAREQFEREEAAIHKCRRHLAARANRPEAGSTARPTHRVTSTAPA